MRMIPSFAFAPNFDSLTNNRPNSMNISILSSPSDCISFAYALMSFAVTSTMIVPSFKKNTGKLKIHQPARKKQDYSCFLFRYSMFESSLICSSIAARTGLRFSAAFICSRTSTKTVDFTNSTACAGFIFKSS